MNSIFECHNQRGTMNLMRHYLALRCLCEHKVKQKIYQIHTETIVSTL